MLWRAFRYFRKGRGGREVKGTGRFVHTGLTRPAGTVPWRPRLVSPGTRWQQFLSSPLGRAFGQVGSPVRIAVVGGADQPPVRPARHRRHAAQAPAELLDQPVGLAMVAAHAGSDAVLPGVHPAAAARYHVIDGLGLDAAVADALPPPGQVRRP